MRLRIFAASLVLFAMVQVGGQIAAEGLSSESSPAISHDRIYFFEHRLLPQWTHETDGAFFDDLMNDRTEKLKAAAAKIVGDAFSKEITIRKFSERKSVLLIFPTPIEESECFFAYIASIKNGYKYCTYEKTFDLFERGKKGVIGSWSSDGTRINIGSRKYDDIDSFIAEMEKLL